MVLIFQNYILSVCMNELHMLWVLEAYAYGGTIRFPCNLFSCYKKSLIFLPPVNSKKEFYSFIYIYRLAENKRKTCW